MLTFRPRITYTFASLTFCSVLLLFASSIQSADAQEKTPLSIELVASDYREVLSPSDFASWFRLDTTLVFTSTRRSEVEDTNYCPGSLWYCDLALSRFKQERLSVRFKKTAEEEKIREYVQGLASRVNQEAKDALFGVSGDNTVIVTSAEALGRRLKEDEATIIILRTLQTGHKNTLLLPITLPTEVTMPKIVGSDRERLGLRELIGEGKSNFKGSPKNRIFNINRSLEQYQNVIIAPGEEFSFVEYLGEVDGEHGYLPELVIKNNQTTPEFGGGICQVSSTVFRAAIYSGLKITERRNHAYAVQYYKPIGMDATIYIPKPDLKFTNNTPGHILMQATIENFDLTFRFFGTKDGRTIKVDGPHILERGDDGSMKTVFTQEVNDATGGNFIRDNFWSNYKSPSLFPHQGEEKTLTEKPKNWSAKQWDEYKAIRP